MAVRCGTNQEVIYEAMRQVLAARAIHNIFRTTESHLMVTSSSLRSGLFFLHCPKYVQDDDNNVSQAFAGHMLL